MNISGMEAENARRNLKDFLTMYNHFTETCFERCVKNLNYRILTPEEESCTKKCTDKLVNVNHRQISVYMEINPLNRKLNELNANSGSDGATSPEELPSPPPNLAQQVEEVFGKDAIAVNTDNSGVPQTVPQANSKPAPEAPVSEES